jgi:hypothetical protein
MPALNRICWSDAGRLSKFDNPALIASAAPPFCAAALTAAV